jgi:hypothetical protein
MKKAEALKHWEQIPEQQPILPHWEPIPYKAKGSTYGACGIRIDGNPEFIDAVLSRLKDLIAGENHATRLTLARSEVAPKLEINGKAKHFTNTADRAEVCYIRLHERGSEGQHASAIFDRHLDRATGDFFAALKTA